MPERNPGSCAVSGPVESGPHSAEQFGPQGDFWWNRDFLDLMAARWRLHEAASLADIGCGVGHWSRLLYPYLRPPARLAGVDREPRWVVEASEKFPRDRPSNQRERVSARDDVDQIGRAHV